MTPPRMEIRPAGSAVQSECSESLATTESTLPAGTDPIKMSVLDEASIKCERAWTRTLSGGVDSQPIDVTKLASDNKAYMCKLCFIV